MTITFDRPERTLENGNEFWETLRRQYDLVQAEVLFIARNVPGVSPEYIESKPVGFRRKLVNDILKEQNKGNDGSGVVAGH